MKIFLSPQIPLNPSDRIEYEFEEDIIKVKLPDGTNDTFDFTEFPDGELQVYDDEGTSLIDTELTFNVIINAKRVNGELSVELVNYIGTDAPEHERFPEWIDYIEYQPAKESESVGEDDLERLEDPESREEGSGETGSATE